MEIDTVKYKNIMLTNAFVLEHIQKLLNALVSGL